MHAFLIQSTNPQICKIQIDNLAKEKNAKILNYPIKTIDDVRNLNNLTRLTLTEPTLIVCENIHEAGVEALNAFLKNLEEPQENLYFALTTSSIRKVLPTIVSRCEIIRSTNQNASLRGQINQSTNLEAEKFLEMTTGEKLNYIDKIKDRQVAMELVENAVAFMHQILHSNSKLHSDQVKYSVTAKNIEAATETLTRLKANGNVSLQLTNLVVRMNS